MSHIVYYNYVISELLEDRSVQLEELVEKMQLKKLPPPCVMLWCVCLSLSEGMECMTTVLP